MGRSKTSSAAAQHQEMVKTYHRYLMQSGLIKSAKKYKGRAKRLLAESIRAMHGGESPMADSIDRMPFIYIITGAHEDFKQCIHILFRLPDIKDRKLKKKKADLYPGTEKRIFKVKVRKKKDHDESWFDAMMNEYKREKKGR